ncbi:MAG TPA: DUF3568 family protein [Verrucomicrobiae bacterium]|nr:DUF3568 family protein [Verrucomicrobiae bacterium]
MRTTKWIGIAVLLASMVVGQGCALLVVGAVGAAGAAGAVSYVGNELHVTQEVSVDRAWNAALASMQDLQFRLIRDKTVKDATGGVVNAYNAKDQRIIIQLARQSDTVTEIRIRVGTFDTTANRDLARLIYDKMRAHL